MIYKCQRVNLISMNLIKNSHLFLEIEEDLNIEDYCLLTEKKEGTCCSVYKIVDKYAFFDYENNILNENKKFVLKLDLQEYIQKTENQMKLEHIEKILEEKAKNIEKYITFENLAKYDKDAEKLFEDYKNIINFKSNNLLEDRKV